MTEEETQSNPETSRDKAAEQLYARFFRAAYMGNLAGLKEAVHDGADVNAWHDATGLTALHYAVGTNNIQMLKYLVETAGARIVPDRSGRWPTVIAIDCRAGEEVSDYIVEEEAKLPDELGEE